MLPFRARVQAIPIYFLSVFPLSPQFAATRVFRVPGSHKITLEATLCPVYGSELRSREGAGAGADSWRGQVRRLVEMKRRVGGERLGGVEHLAAGNRAGQGKHHNTTSFARGKGGE